MCCGHVVFIPSHPSSHLLGLHTTGPSDYPIQCALCMSFNLHFSVVIVVVLLLLLLLLRGGTAFFFNALDVHRGSGIPNLRPLRPPPRG